MIQSKINSMFLVLSVFLFNPKYSLSTGGDSEWTDCEDSAVESSAMSEYNPGDDESYAPIIGTLLPSSKTAKEEVSEKDKEVLRLSAEVNELTSTVKYLLRKERRDKIEQRQSFAQYKTDIDEVLKKNGLNKYRTQ